MATTTTARPRRTTAAQGFLFIIIPPVVGGFLLGLFLQSKAEWIKPTTVASTMLSCSLLLAAFTRLRRGNTGSALRYWLLWLSTLALLGYLQAPPAWAVWIAPVIGVAIGLLGTVAVIIAIGSRPKRQATTSSAAPTPTVSRHDTINATVGLPNLGTVDVGQSVNASLNAQVAAAQAQAQQAQAAWIERLESLHDKGKINDAQLYAALAKLGFDIPAKPIIEPSDLTASTTLVYKRTPPVFASNIRKGKRK